MMQYRYQGVSAGGSIVTWQTAAPDPTGALAPELVSNVVQTNIPVLQAGDVVGGKSWHTELSVDFTALTTQTFGADGSISLGGALFSVVNLANLEPTRTMGILNGSGLRTARSSTGNSNSADYTWPMLTWDMPVSVVNGVPVRCAILTSATADAEYSWRGVGMMLAYPSTSTASRSSIAVNRCSRGDVAQLQICGREYACNTDHSPTSQPTQWGSSGMMADWTWDVAGIDCPEGVGYGTRKYTTWGQNSLGQYADLNKANRFAWFPTVAPVNAYGGPPQADAAMFQAENWKLCLLGTDNAAPQAYIRAVKFEAYY